MRSTRDPGRFPHSLAYLAQPGLVKLSAAALALAYCHLHMFEHNDQPKRRQEEPGWYLFEKVMCPAMAGGCRFVPLPPGLVFTDDGGTRMHLANDCLAESVKRTVQVLRMSWDEFHAVHLASFDRAAGPPPAAWLHPDDLATVLWLEDACRMVASGAYPLEATRSAYDRARGKPRRRRQPMQAAWLAERVRDILTCLWWALLHARLGAGGGPLWLTGPLVDETRRPVWSYSQGR